MFIVSHDVRMYEFPPGSKKQPLGQSVGHQIAYYVTMSNGMRFKMNFR